MNDPIAEIADAAIHMNSMCGKGSLTDDSDVEPNLKMAIHTGNQNTIESVDITFIDIIRHCVMWRNTRRLSKACDLWNNLRLCN